ncbi:hypothetical protein MASR1M60_30680 [Rhodocyclaceae bacterium]
MKSKKPDTITNADLPALRVQLLGYIADADFSDRFRLACVDAIEAIDEAVAADAATNARLQLALEAWKIAGDAEAAAC